MSRLSTQDLVEVNIKAILQKNNTINEDMRKKLESLCESVGHIEDVDSHEQFMDFIKNFHRIFFTNKSVVARFEVALQREKVTTRIIVSEFEKAGANLRGSSLDQDFECYQLRRRHRFRKYALPYCRIQLEERDKEMQQGIAYLFLDSILRNDTDIFDNGKTYDFVFGTVLLFFMPNGLKSGTQKAFVTCESNANFLLSQRRKTVPEETEIVNDSVNNISFLNS